MKKILCILIGILSILTLTLPPTSFAEGAAAVEATDASTGEPFTWAYLATIAGAAAFALVFVQFFKVPLDRVWKIPTRVFVYIVCFAVMLVGLAFTEGLTAQSVLLAAANAVISALSAYGGYELTFAKLTK